MAVATPDLREAVVLLAAAGLVVPVMHRLKVNPILGFLAVGALIGPHGLGSLSGVAPWLGAVTITDPKAVQIAGEFGVMFLLFMIGLEISLERLWRLRRLVFGLGSAQVVVTATAISAIAVAFGNPPGAAVVLGACLALSSTAVVMQLLTDDHRLGTPVGQVAVAVLLMQDLAVVPILFLVGALGAGPEAVATGLAIAFGKALIAIVVLVGAGRLVVGPMLRLVAATGSRESFLAAVLLAIVGIAAATNAAGLSMALGAFLVGLVLAETEFRHRIAVDLEPFKGLLLGIFFLSVGLVVDLRAVLAEPIWLPLSVIGLVALKAAILYALSRLFGEKPATAAEVAILLGTGGEFAFVVIGLAMALGHLPTATGQFMLVAVALSLAATPFLASLARRIAVRIEPGEDHRALTDDVRDDLAGHVVIVGYGRVGRMIGELLDGQSIPHVALETRVDRVKGLRAVGAAVHYGDGVRPEILARLGLDRAAALVVTMDDPQAVAHVASAARRDHPDLPIIVRVRDEAHARELLAAGATHVTPETLEASLQLGEAVLRAVGLPFEAAQDLVQAQRTRRIEPLSRV